MTVVLDRRLITVDDYHKMIEVGVFNENDRIELLNGEIINMSPINSNHSGHVNQIHTFLTYLLFQKAIVSVQNPVVVKPLSQPEPDIVILKIRDDYYKKSHPNPEDIIVLIEVSDTTLNKDKTVKSSIYARSNIPHYWIVNLQDNVLELYSNPKNGKYKSIEIKEIGDSIIIPQFGQEVQVSSLLG